ncbi:hypothetical protein SFPB_081 [Shigella phage SFPB]|uniref:Uncharacterized protein n=1 Tax=Shigella phage SFPB TaxID=3017292 RepID=A0AAE9VYB5_9CAUD|nr:hypothetical protein SFPB_081 [Shigella phage SFPB]
MTEKNETFFVEGYLLLPRPSNTYMRFDIMPTVMDYVTCHIFMQGVSAQLKHVGRDCKIRVDNHPEINENHYTWFGEDSKEIYAVLKTRK